jgi:hypothetical protein
VRACMAPGASAAAAPVSAAAAADAVAARQVVVLRVPFSLRAALSNALLSLVSPSALVRRSVEMYVFVVCHFPQRPPVAMTILLTPDRQREGNEVPFWHHLLSNILA